MTGLYMHIHNHVHLYDTYPWNNSTIKTRQFCFIINYFFFNNTEKKEEKTINFE
jgi:hypothetical protein